MKRFIVWLVVAILGLAGVVLAHEVKHVDVPVRNELERAIEVKQLENKFSVMESYFLGGAGAGGMGAPVVAAKSAQQFAELVPAKENVYIAWEFQREVDGRANLRTLKKVYWAFIENRAGVMVYEDVYRYDIYEVEKFTSENVTFRFDNLGSLIFLYLLAIVIIGLIFSMVNPS